MIGAGNRKAVTNATRSAIGPVILINTYESPPSFIMVPRGDRIADRLDDLILNFAGPLSVARPFYQEVVTTCARACCSPEANIASMTEFVGRHERHWTDRAWHPE